MKYRIRTAVCVIAIGATLAVPLAHAGDEPGDEANGVEAAQDPEAQKKLESQLASFDGKSPLELVPEKWQTDLDPQSYLSSLVEKLKSDYKALTEGKSLGNFYGNPVHPFLERGGAIRDDVPLPKDAAQYEQLLEFVLEHNPRNKDKLRYDRKLFERIAKQRYGRQFAVNDKLTGFFGRDLALPGSELYSPNLIVLMTSIVVQQADQDMYGDRSRGRYGELTYNRVRVGNAGVNKQPEEHVYNGFIYETDTQVPVAVVVASTNEKDLGIPTIYQHFGFSRAIARTTKLQLIDAPGLQPIANAPTMGPITGLIGAITAAALAEAYSKPNLSPKDVILQGHTDKVRAAFLAEALIDKKVPFSDKLRDKTGQAAFEKLYPEPEKAFYHPFKDNGALPRSFVGVDGSTVPKGDVGTEYPEPNSEFYRELFRIWRTEILPSQGVDAQQIAALPAELRNGSITVADLENRLGDYSAYAPEVFEALKNPQFTELRQTFMDPQKSKQFGGPVTAPAVVEAKDGTFYVAHNFPINVTERAHKYLRQGLANQIASLSPALAAIVSDQAKGGKLDRFVAPLADALATIAREGNTGDIDVKGSKGQTIPSVAGLAVFGVGPLNQRTMYFADMIYRVSDMELDEQTYERRQRYLFDQYRKQKMEEILKEREEGKLPSKL